MNEVHEILSRALGEPLILTFTTAREARLWIFRAHNFKRRHAPEMAQLMISQDGMKVKIRVPQFTVETIDGN